MASVCSGVTVSHNLAGTVIWIVAMCVNYNYWKNGELPAAQFHYCPPAAGGGTQIQTVKLKGATFTYNRTKTELLFHRGFYRNMYFKTFKLDHNASYKNINIV
ncbi:hypothetical protein XENOCAPTIV_025576 [Xenoophorus captivus]|uniref:Uncharacterized protein n=1 Tax=Xenoophorus captivus TaxID=1517983 RepID=A0ABV0RKM2_9TELE